MPEALKPGDVYVIPAKDGEVSIYRRIVVLGPSDLSTIVKPATEAEYESQQQEKQASS